jgi:hypothetical protein
MKTKGKTRNRHSAVEMKFMGRGAKHTKEFKTGPILNKSFIKQIGLNKETESKETKFPIMKTVQTTQEKKL